MSELFNRELAPLKGRDILVVMNDGHSYRGNLADFDDQWLKLTGVSEGTTANIKGWEEPAVSMGFVEKVVTFRGVHTKQGAHNLRSLKDVLVQVSQVLRIWALIDENLGEPQHITMERRN